MVKTSLAQWTRPVSFSNDVIDTSSVEFVVSTGKGGLGLWNVERDGTLAVETVSRGDGR